MANLKVLDGDADAKYLSTNGAGTDADPHVSHHIIDEVPALEQPTVTLYNVTLTSADTEYSQALPADCRAFQFQCRTSYVVRYAFVTGKVAGPTEPYFTLKSGTVWYKEGLKLSSATLYLASSQASVVVEIEVWT